MTKDEICGLLRQIHDVLAMQSETNHWAQPVAHWSDCAVHSEPAYPAGECNCGGYTPQQRTWVGLTDEEVQALRYKIDSTAHWTYDEFARVIEAKLKEKNNG